MPLYEDLVRRALEARGRTLAFSRRRRRTRALAQLLRDAHDGRAMLVRCAWCSSFQVEKAWLHLEAIGDGQVQITHELLDRASHGICPECLALQLRLSEEHRGQGRATTPDRLRHRSD